MSTSDESRKPAGEEEKEEPVPRLPRGKGMSLPVAQLLRIAMFLVFLVAVLTLRKSCAANTGQFIQSFEPAAEKTAPAPVEPAQELPPGQYVRLTGDMSEEEIRQKIESLAGEGEDAAVEEAAPVEQEAAEESQGEGGAEPEPQP